MERKLRRIRARKMEKESDKKVAKISIVCEKKPFSLSEKMEI